MNCMFLEFFNKVDFHVANLAVLSSESCCETWGQELEKSGATSRRDHGTLLRFGSEARVPGATSTQYLILGDQTILDLL